MVTIFIYLLFFCVFIFFVFFKRSKDLPKHHQSSKFRLHEIEVQGKKIKCHMCGNNKFYWREGLLNTTWVTFFKFAFFNASGSCYYCASCGYIHWFHPNYKDKQKITFDKPKDEVMRELSVFCNIKSRLNALQNLV